MTTVCKKNMCCGCGLCAEVCTKNAIKIIDNIDSFDAIIDNEKCIKCNACKSMCSNNSPVECITPISWFQGWSASEDMRKMSSSGGFASAIAYSFLENGGMVCSCLFHNGEFIFDFITSYEDLKRFSGSKYVKSDPRNVYKRIRQQLKMGEKILFIGLPCQVASLKKYIGDDLGESLYTVDLICHGTPSSRLLNIFLKQYGTSLKELSNISFRRKFKFNIEGNEKPITSNRVSDCYSTAFLNGLSYTENCYHCQYAQYKRVSDLTIGDSWGSELVHSEIKKGISLVLCMTDKGSSLLNISSLHLEEVDINKAVANNKQLESPMLIPKKRKYFFEGIKKGKKFNNVVYKCLPILCFKQFIKSILITLHLWGGV